MIGFLIAVLATLIVLYGVSLLADAMKLPDPIKKVVLLIVGLIGLLIALSQLGIMGRGVVAW